MVYTEQFELFISRRYSKTIWKYKCTSLFVSFGCVLKDLLVYFMHVCMCLLSLCVLRDFRRFGGWERATDTLEREGVIDDCELPRVHAGSQTLVLGKGSGCSNH